MTKFFADTPESPDPENIEDESSAEASGASMQENNDDETDGNRDEESFNSVSDSSNPAPELRNCIPVFTREQIDILAAVIASFK